eukprot:scaffold295327_cov22-Prasinocladus_malaysianus.AAC.1
MHSRIFFRDIANRGPKQFLRWCQNEEQTGFVESSVRVWIIQKGSKLLRVRVQRQCSRLHQSVRGVYEYGVRVATT